MELTPHQKERLETAFLSLQKNNILVIKGKAGTGKTTLVNFLIKKLIISRSRCTYKDIYCTAPTNKAVKVLKDKTQGISNIKFSTVHSCLKLKRNINPKTGEISFVQDIGARKIPIDNCSLLIVDESSMLNSEIINKLESYKNLTTMIFIGDEAQLPPVGEQRSKIFYQGLPEIELTEIIRQGEGNPIIALSRDFNLIRTKTDNRIPDIGGYIFSNSINNVVSTLSHVNGSDDLKYLAWTNREVDYVNKKVRENIYTSPNKIELNESLIFNTPYNDYFTNDEIKVESLEVKSYPYTIYKCNNPDYNMHSLDQPQELHRKEEIKVYIINNEIPVIHEDSEELFNNIKKDIRSLITKKALNWRHFFEFTEQFADLKYNHAITIHKSQGSTFNQTIINIKDIYLNKDSNERNKLLYTAITRARKLVILYNS